MVGGYYAAKLLHLSELLTERLTTTDLLSDKSPMQSEVIKSQHWMWTVKYQGAALQIKQIRDGDMKMAYDMALVFWMRCEWDDLVRKEWQIKKEWGRIEDRGKPKEMMDRGTILYRCYLCQVVALYGIKHKSNTMKQRLMGIYLFCRYLIINVLTKKCGDHPDNCNSSSSLFIKRLFFKHICLHPHPQVQFFCCMHKRVALTWTRQVKLHENFHVNKSREEERKCVFVFVTVYDWNSSWPSWHWL